MKKILQFLMRAQIAACLLAVVAGALAPISAEAQIRLRPEPSPPLVQQPAISGGAFACMADAGDPRGTGKRDLAGAMRTDYKSMTNESCRSSCAQQGFAYSATQYGGSCFCGNTFGKYGEAASASPPRSCNLGCAGNPNEVCGGEWANSVSLTGAIPPPPADGGQCLVKAQGNYMTSGGAAGRYNGVELHRWEKLATTASNPMMKTYSFRYTMSVSGFMDQTGAGSQWRKTWGGSTTRSETWNGVPATNPATGQPGWQLATAQGFSTTVPYTGHLLNPLRPDPTLNPTAIVRAFAYPLRVYSTGSAYVFPATTGTTMQAIGIASLWSNPLGNATYTCSWNVTI